MVILLCLGLQKTVVRYMSPIPYRYTIHSLRETFSIIRGNFWSREKTQMLFTYSRVPQGTATDRGPVRPLWQNPKERGKPHIGYRLSQFPQWDRVYRDAKLRPPPRQPLGWGGTIFPFAPPPGPNARLTKVPIRSIRTIAHSKLQAIRILHPQGGGK